MRWHEIRTISDIMSLKLLKGLTDIISVLVGISGFLKHEGTFMNF